MPIGFSPTGTFFVLFFSVLFSSSQFFSVQFFSKPYGIQLVTPKVVASAVNTAIAI
jgi:hypothetical protein